MEEERTVAVKQRPIRHVSARVMALFFFLFYTVSLLYLQGYLVQFQQIEESIYTTPF